MNDETPWSGDWCAVLTHGLKQLKYETITDLVRSRDGSVTFPEIARELGGRSLAPKQIEIVMRSEATTNEDYLYFAKAALVSRLRDMLPKQDPIRSPEFHKIHPLVAWKTMISESHEQQCDIVIDRILEHSEYCGNWLPSGTDDPVIDLAFEGLDFSLPPKYR